MFVFLKLVLAHLIADFMFQFEELYQLKTKHFLGHVFHILIHGTITTLLLFPYLNEPWVLIFIIAMMAEHLIQDLLKYRFTQKIPAKRFIYYMTDQVFHTAFLGIIFFFPYANEVRPVPGPLFLNWLYQDPVVTNFFIFSILLTFTANYTLHSFYKSYLKNTRPLHWITSPEMAVTIIERGVIAATLLFAPGLLWLFLSLSVGLLRVPFKPLRDFRDFLVSAAYALTLSAVYLAVS